jgi:outer membrane lipoprotein SlyB
MLNTIGTIHSPAIGGIVGSGVGEKAVDWVKNWF